MIEQVRFDLDSVFWRKPRLVAAALTPQQILRSLVLMASRLGLSRIARADCRWMHTAPVHGLLLSAVPRHDAFHRGSPG